MKTKNALRINIQAYRYVDNFIHRAMNLCIAVTFYSPLYYFTLLHICCTIFLFTLFLLSNSLFITLVNFFSKTRFFEYCHIFPSRFFNFFFSIVYFRQHFFEFLDLFLLLLTFCHIFC